MQARRSNLIDFTYKFTVRANTASMWLAFDRISVDDDERRRWWAVKNSLLGKLLINAMSKHQNIVQSPHTAVAAWTRWISNEDCLSKKIFSALTNEGISPGGRARNVKLSTQKKNLHAHFWGSRNIFELQNDDFSVNFSTLRRVEKFCIFPSGCSANHVFFS